MTRPNNRKSSELPRDPSKKLVLFYRDFRAFTGGHLKVWDYFNHVGLSPTHESRIAFSPESKWDETNPWAGARSYLTNWKVQKADVLFLAGSDWRMLSKAEQRNSSKPIINLIQHPRHADPNNELHGFLENRAVRICVSEQVAEAISATRKVNGPLFVIPNGIELGALPKRVAQDQRAIDVLISGLKAPDLAREVHKAVASEGRKVHCLTDWIPRDQYLARLSDAKIVVVLPRPVEGFYLPALEGMACGALVVCPDCLGNREFCQDGVNCFRPKYNASKIATAAIAALPQPPAEMARMLENAAATVLQHSLEHERASFLRILGRLDELWRT